MFEQSGYTSWRISTHTILDAHLVNDQFVLSNILKIRNAVNVYGVLKAPTIPPLDLGHLRKIGAYHFMQ